MNGTRLDPIQAFVVISLAFWLFALGISFMLQQHSNYLRWSGKSLNSLWRNGWQFIVGVAIGYLLSGQPFLSFIN